MKWPLLLRKGLAIFAWRLRHQGLRDTFTWFWTRCYLWIVGRPVWRYSCITPQLSIEGQVRAAGWRWLTRRGITADLNLRSEFDDAAHGIAPDAYLWLPVPDDHAPTLCQFNTGVTFMRQIIEQGGKVYVHCASGVGRAPTMAAAYLISTGMTVEDALRLIRRVRPFIKLTPPQLAALEEFAAQVQRHKESAGTAISLEWARPPARPAGRHAAEPGG